mgnify:CR=1 FL=1
MMLDCEARRGELELRRADAQLFDVTAVIGVTGRVKGVVAISFALQTALNTVERFLGESHGGLTPEVIDGLSELANMIGGSTKSKLNMGLNIGLPSVVSGPNHRIDFPTESKPMRVHYASDAGPFFVDFGIVSRTL